MKNIKINEKDFSQQILNQLKLICPEKKFYALHEPNFVGKEWEYVKECIDTKWVSSAGKFVDEFEKKIAQFTGVKYAIATSSGTAALHVALLLAGIKPNDEVLTPTLTFVATTNAIKYCNAIPHFVDSDYQTLGVNPKKLERYLKEITIIKNNECINKKTNRRIKALIVMHTFGHAVNLTEIVKIAKKYKIDLIEDAAEALGTYYKNKHVGNWGKLSILSFNGNKLLTTGGGGMILTNNKTLAKKAKFITTTAKKSHPYLFNHSEIGFNYRLPNINAALGVAQMEYITQTLEKKRQLAQKYIEIFQDLKGLKTFNEPKYCKSNYWLNVLLLDEPNIKLRNQILEKTNSNNIMTRPVWTLMHKLPIFKDCPKMNLNIAENISKRLINMPSSTFL
ncbi:MAG: LegC family aminotransferase [Candidatus Shapirobacteria bacterium]|nr:LegC family aminotransferase [Candidatus Shapirobacteria bacterium]MDD3002705.1 LegC family aminotransferase [Candidatus Shapirobacteria bacterium]MDD4383216.1 LegC family aminotransferase [Candidatus Shapirobacteria bacterium]